MSVPATSHAPLPAEQDHRSSAVTAETAAILSLIERAARDPSIDIDRMERLMQMQRDTTADRARVAYQVALAALQPDLPVIRERGEIRHDNKLIGRYALWEDVNQQIRPVLARHGFAITFRVDHDGDKLLVTGVLTHRDGHREQTTMRLPADMSGKKNPVQALGSSTSYGKRYTAMALLNLTSGDSEDDDGARGGGPGLVSQDEASFLAELAGEVGADLPAFLKHMGVPSLADVPADRYEQAVAALEAKRRRAGSATSAGAR